MKKIFALSICFLVAVTTAWSVQERQDTARTSTFGPGGSDHLLLRVPQDALVEAKRAPKAQYKYKYSAQGYGQLPNEKEYRLRFRFYAQSPFAAGSINERIAKYFLFLWDLNARKLDLDHADKTGQLVDVYLTKEGKAGGEQYFGVEDIRGGKRNVNAVFLYDIDNFGSTLELMREASHEYGHAALPPVGGYKSPENWANGHTGERLYMLWMLDHVQNRRLAPDAILGDPDLISEYLKKNVAPYVFRIMDRGPNTTLLKGTNAEAMNEYIGLVLALEGLLPRESFARSLVVADAQTAIAYHNGLREALLAKSSWTLNLASRRGRATWLPIGKGKVTGGKVLERNGMWAKVMIESAQVKISP